MAAGNFDRRLRKLECRDAATRDGAPGIDRPPSVSREEWLAQQAHDEGRGLKPHNPGRDAWLARHEQEERRLAGEPVH